MVIKPFCKLCKRELEDFGAILLSPPDSFDKVEKSHICKKCYLELTKEFNKKDK